MKKILITLLFVTGLQAQTAKVVQLSPEEAAQAKSLYAQKAEIEKKIEFLNDEIRSRYLTEPSGNTGNCWSVKDYNPCVFYKDGWFTGKFTYSEDYKFIVPLASAESNVPQSWPGWIYAGSATPITR